MEKAYGTVFFAALNIWIQVVCTAIKLLDVHAKVFWLPENLGGVSTLAEADYYSAGYSTIYFGLIMLLCLMGSKYIYICGCLPIPTFILPFVFLVAVQYIADVLFGMNVDFVGHLAGIIAALIVRYAGFYPARLLPQYSWL